MDGIGLILIFVFAALMAIVGKVILNAAKRKRLMIKYGNDLVVDKIMKRCFWQGMSAEMLLDSLGKPIDVGTRVLKAKTVHTYKYNQTGKNRFGTRITLENGIVTGWDQK